MLGSSNGARSNDFIVIDDAPSNALLTTLASQQIDTLVLVDHRPFANGIADDLSPIDAVRDEAQHAIFIIEVARRAGRILVLSDTEIRSWPTTLAMILGKDVSPTIPSSPRLAIGEMIDWPLTQSYLKPLFGAIPLASPLVLTWPRESFFDGDLPGAPLPELIELAGRARILAYGPYLPLPSGTWLAKAYLGFSADVEKMPFILEADSGRGITRGFFEVMRGGIFTLTLDLEIADAFQPVELRLISQESTLEGQAALIEVQLERSGRSG